MTPSDEFSMNWYGITVLPCWLLAISGSKPADFAFANKAVKSSTVAGGSVIPI